MQWQFGASQMKNDMQALVHCIRCFAAEQLEKVRQHVETRLHEICCRCYNKSRFRHAGLAFWLIVIQ